MSLTIQRPSIPVPLTMARGGTEATNPAGARAKLELGDLALLTAPGGTTTFLRADKTWAVPAGGGGSATLLGLTDVPDSYVGQANKLLAVRPDETGTEFISPAAGGYSDEQAQDAIGAILVNTATIAMTYSDAAQQLGGNVVASSIGTTQLANNGVTEAKLGFSDVTTKDASITAHGLLRKLSGTVTEYLNGAGAWTTPAGGGGGAPTDAEYITSTVNASLSAERVLTDTATITWDRATAGQIKANAIGGGGGAPTDAEYITSVANASLSLERVLADSATITWDRSVAGQITAHAIGGGGYTDEQAQDAVGAMLVDSATIDLTYTDATPALTASVIDASITEAKLSLSDVTTLDASISAHGLLRKLSGTATQYLDGSGAWTTPAGGGDTSWTRNPGTPLSLATGLLAFWRMEEASGNRLDRWGARAGAGRHHRQLE